MTNSYPLRSAEWIDALGEPARHTVLAIDDVASNLDQLRDLLEQDGYRVLTASRGSDALDMLDAGPMDLIILDRSLPGMDAAEFCRLLRSSHAGRVNGLEEPEAILLALTQAVELRDPNIAGHSDRLAALAVAMGMTMGLPPVELRALHHGGHLHDIGKLVMPDSILFKKGSLTDEEWVIMRTHTVKGEAICRPARSLSPILPIIRSHHERWDGSGYPDGLAGDHIPLLARVMQLADIYDALTSTRCYKEAVSPADARSVMQEETDRGWCDPELMRIFLSLRPDTMREAFAFSADRSWDLKATRVSLDNLRTSVLRA